MWEYELPDETVRFSSPAVEPDWVYVGGTDGVMRALDMSTGEEQWTFHNDFAFSASPLVTQESVFAGNLGRTIYAFDKRTGLVQWDLKLRGRIKSGLAVRDGKLVVFTEPRYVYLFAPPLPEAYASNP